MRPRALSVSAHDRRAPSARRWRRRRRLSPVEGTLARGVLERAPHRPRTGHGGRRRCSADRVNDSSSPARSWGALAYHAERKAEVDAYEHFASSVSTRTRHRGPAGNLFTPTRVRDTWARPCPRRGALRRRTAPDRRQARRRPRCGGHEPLAGVANLLRDVGRHLRGPVSKRRRWTSPPQPRAPPFPHVHLGCGTARECHDGPRRRHGVQPHCHLLQRQPRHGRLHRPRRGRGSDALSRCLEQAYRHPLGGRRHRRRRSLSRFTEDGASAARLYPVVPRRSSLRPTKFLFPTLYHGCTRSMHPGMRGDDRPNHLSFFDSVVLDRRAARRISTSSEGRIPRQLEDPLPSCPRRRG